MCQLLFLLPIAPPLPLYRPQVFFISHSRFLFQIVVSGWFSRACRLSFSPLVSHPILCSLPFVTFSHFPLCDNFPYRLVMETLRELYFKKVIKGFQGHTKAKLVTFCSGTSPQGFHTSFQLLSLHQPFPSVQENQEVEAAAVKPGRPGGQVTTESQRGIQSPCVPMLPPAPWMSLFRCHYTGSQV